MKKLLIIAVVIAMLTTMSTAGFAAENELADSQPTPDTQQTEYTLGDINSNGEIDSMDYVLLKRAYFGTYELGDETIADVNGNGNIDSMDYVLLKRAYFGTYASIYDTQYEPIITYIHADWPYYDSIAKLVDAADNVFEGKVTGIEFDIVVKHTGESATLEDDPARLHLYTIYEVDIAHSYKGENTDKAYIKVMGGMAGYKESEQCKMMEQFGIFDKRMGIPVLDDIGSLEIGDSYLFLTHKNASKYHIIVNNAQFAYNVNNSSQPTDFAYESIKKYVSEIKKNSSAIPQD